MIDILPKYTGTLDKFAVSASALCAVHCLSLPLLLGVFPALGATFFGQEAFHVLLLWFVIPLSVVSLSIGVRQHKSGAVAILGLAGLTILCLAAFFGHDLLGEDGERAATLLGATIIAAAHLRNFSLCRQVACDH